MDRMTSIARTGIAATALVAGLAAVSTTPAPAQDMSRAIARLSTTDGKPAGEVEFTETPRGVLIEVLAAGLSPGEHAIHLHETGSCSPDFSAAGSHFAPEGNGHGYLTEDGPHAGDLPNIFVGVDNAVSAHFLNQRVTLGESGSGLLDADGTAVIVHANPDTYTSDAGAGDRVACGVVEPYI